MTEPSREAREREFALLPCPFCGGRASMFKARGEGPPYIPCCTKCSASLSLEWVEEEAARSWNARSDAALAQARREGIEAAARVAIRYAEEADRAVIRSPEGACRTSVMGEAVAGRAIAEAIRALDNPPRNRS